MATLKITNNSAANPITVDLSQYLDLTNDGGLDNYDPGFTQRVFARSLLKEGATLALQQLVEKGQTWPLLLGPFANTSQMASFIAEINQAINTPGAVLAWQDDGASQPTYFDLISGELQIAYKYREAQVHYTRAKLLTFSQPLGRTAGPRPYAAASGVGPLLMISPYASDGSLAIGASTQAGVAGWGGALQGPSSGVFYSGSPSLAGDAPALLQISYVGPLPNVPPAFGDLQRPQTVPYVAVAALPDANYRPLITSTDGLLASSTIPIAGAVASEASFLSASSTPNEVVLTARLLDGACPLAWEGQHRLLAIARASNVPMGLRIVSSALCPNPIGASVAVGDWQVVDLGCVVFRASEPPPISEMTLLPSWASDNGVGNLTALVMLPDSRTWYLNPTAISPSQYGLPYSLTGTVNFNQAPYSNTVLLDDVLGDQFLYGGQSQTFAPSPAGLADIGAISPYSRGLVPRPDPKDGLPILAILGVGQISAPSTIYEDGASWTNPQNLRTMAQVNVLERTRYVLP